MLDTIGRHPLPHQVCLPRHRGISSGVSVPSPERKNCGICFDGVRRRRRRRRRGEAIVPPLPPKARAFDIVVLNMEPLPVQRANHLRLSAYLSPQRAHFFVREHDSKHVSDVLVKKAVPPQDLPLSEDRTSIFTQKIKPQSQALRCSKK